MKEAKVSEKKYMVKEITQEEIFNLEEFADMFNWSSAKTSKIVEIRVFPNNLRVYVKYGWDEDLTSLSLKKKSTTLKSLREKTFERLYQGPIPLNSKKRKDIEKMLEKKLIPDEHHDTWKKLLQF